MLNGIRADALTCLFAIGAKNKRLGRTCFWSSVSCHAFFLQNSSPCNHPRMAIHIGIMREACGKVHFVATSPRIEECTSSPASPLVPASRISEKMACARTAHQMTSSKEGMQTWGNMNRFKAVKRSGSLLHPCRRTFPHQTGTKSTRPFPSPSSMYTVRLARENMTWESFHVQFSKSFALTIGRSLQDAFRR
jgi:hypothetical protein